MAMRFILTYMANTTMRRTEKEWEHLLTLESTRAEVAQQLLDDLRKDYTEYHEHICSLRRNDKAYISHLEKKDSYSFKLNKKLLEHLKKEAELLNRPFNNYVETILINRNKVK